MKYFATLFLSAALFVACSGESGDPIAPDSNGKTSSSVKSSNSNRAQCKVEIDENCIKDDRDGQTYRTVKIGDQVWMAENLNYFDETLDGISWCYDNDPKKCEVTGRLYTWAAAIDSVGLYDGGNGEECGYGIDCTLPDTVYGICPSGWHLPSSVEWETLIAVVGGDSTAGKMLKSQTGWVHDGNGTDDFGFSALPAGEYDPDDTSFKFNLDGYMGSFWSASEARYFDIQEEADRLSLSYSIENLYLVGWDKNRGYSVRCIKNEP